MNILHDILPQFETNIYWSKLSIKCCRNETWRSKEWFQMHKKLWLLSTIKHNQRPFCVKCMNLSPPIWFINWRLISKNSFLACIHYSLSRKNGPACLFIFPCCPVYSRWFALLSQIVSTWNVFMLGLDYEKNQFWYKGIPRKKLLLHLYMSFFCIL